MPLNLFLYINQKISKFLFDFKLHSAIIVLQIKKVKRIYTMKKTEIKVVFGDIEANLIVKDTMNEIKDFDAFSEELNEVFTEAFGTLSKVHTGVEKEKIYDEATIKKELLDMVKKTEEELTKKQRKLFKKATKELLEKIDVGMPMSLAVLTSEFPFEFNNACKQLQ